MHALHRNRLSRFRYRAPQARLFARRLVLKNDPSLAKLPLIRWMVRCPARSNVRRVTGIKESDCADCILSAFCPHCATVRLHYHHSWPLGPRDPLCPANRTTVPTAPRPSQRIQALPESLCFLITPSPTVPRASRARHPRGEAFEDGRAQPHQDGGGEEREVQDDGPAADAGAGGGREGDDGGPQGNVRGCQGGGERETEARVARPRQ